MKRRGQISGATPRKIALVLHKTMPHDEPEYSSGYVCNFCGNEFTHGPFYHCKETGTDACLECGTTGKTNDRRDSAAPDVAASPSIPKARLGAVRKKGTLDEGAPPRDEIASTTAGMTAGSIASTSAVRGGGEVLQFLSTVIVPNAACYNESVESSNKHNTGGGSNSSEAPVVFGYLVEGAESDYFGVVLTNGVNIIVANKNSKKRPQQGWIIDPAANHTPHPAEILSKALEVLPSHLKPQTKKRMRSRSAAFPGAFEDSVQLVPSDALEAKYPWIATLRDEPQEHHTILLGRPGASDKKKMQSVGLSTPLYVRHSSLVHRFSTGAADDVDRLGDAAMLHTFALSNEGAQIAAHGPQEGVEIRIDVRRQLHGLIRYSGAAGGPGISSAADVGVVRRVLEWTQNLINE